MWKVQILNLAAGSVPAKVSTLGGFRGSKGFVKRCGGKARANDPEAPLFPVRARTGRIPSPAVGSSQDALRQPACTFSSSLSPDISSSSCEPRLVENPIAEGCT